LDVAPDLLVVAPRADEEVCGAHSDDPGGDGEPQPAVPARNLWKNPRALVTHHPLLAVEKG
jgi:hypothetical protein